MEKVLVVGAGGFVGGFIVEEALRRGYEVWAGVRESTSRRYLADKRIHFIVFDFDADAPVAALADALRRGAPEGGDPGCPPSAGVGAISGFPRGWGCVF